MAARIRDFDWARTPLGPIGRWPSPLRLTLSTILEHPLPTVLCWGPDLIALHNDAYRPLLGGKAEALGRPILDVWAEARELIAPQLKQVLAGEAIRLENAPFTLLRHGHLEQAFFNYTLSPVRDETGTIVGLLNTAFETTEQVRAERQRASSQEHLRVSEQRQVFLLRLSDALRAEPNADAIAERGLEMLFEHLRLDRCFIGVYRVADDRADLPHQVGNEHVPPLPESIRLSDFPNALRIAIAGTLVIDDFAETEGLSDADRQSIGGLGLRALVSSTLKDGANAPLWTTIAASSKARRWTRDEIAVVEESAERIWGAMERARGELALRESEGRFAQFAASSADALWIRDAATLHMEYASPAIQAIYGVAPESVLGPIERWAALIVPEDREAALAHVEEARSGLSVVREFRIRRPSDGEERWVRDTDFPLYDEHGCVRRVGGIAEDVTEAKRAADRQDVLVNELQHRARNLLGVIRSIADRTVKRGDSVEAFEVRLQALSRAQGLLSQGGSDTVELGALVRAELAAHANGASDHVAVSGPEVHLKARQVQNFALALHELTTNAVKYGALHVDTGRLSVTWEAAPDRRGRRRLALRWVESGVAIAPEQVTRRGYGTELIQEALAYALQGEVEYVLGEDGVHCRIEMPISDPA